jgi:hypothetical protein
MLFDVVGEALDLKGYYNEMLCLVIEKLVGETLHLELYYNQ